jgi:hypothetical protein
MIRRALSSPARRAPRHLFERAADVDRGRAPEWHRARANSLRKNGFTKMAKEHEQLAPAIERRREQQQQVK